MMFLASMKLLVSLAVCRHTLTFGKVSVRSDHTCLRAVDGSGLKHGGVVEVLLRHGARTEVATAHIVRGARSLLGIRGLMQLGFLPHDWPDNTAGAKTGQAKPQGQEEGRLLGAMTGGLTQGLSGLTGGSSTGGVGGVAAGLTGKLESLILQMQVSHLLVMPQIRGRGHLLRAVPVTPGLPF